MHFTVTKSCISLWTVAFNQLNFLTLICKLSLAGLLLGFVTFSPLKTSSMIISRNCNPVFPIPLFIDGTMIKNTSSHMHLGLTFTNSGTWDEHVKSISEKILVKAILVKSSQI